MNNKTVYKTPTGKKYHTDKNCSYLKKIIPIKYEEIEKHELTLCSRCEANQKK